ncbi:MAG: excinuclease ABC subunit UvrA, partial [candidate division WOR-3 bacterium]|nr:excinuclease ABC subunit UvrA [candidate division WOR-3 bacterium]
MVDNFIVVKGARVHNLKNITVKIPRNKLVVITGISGSGKSSLAFDTIYAEGQRRYIESLSAYARQFLGMLDKPDVDQITGLSPAIAIEQRTAAKNPRSTVGTVTEIYDYLRVLFARIGKPYCPSCNKPISSQTVDSIVDTIFSLLENKRIAILAPVVRGRKGEYRDLIEKIRRKGYLRVRVDGTIYDLEDVPSLEKYKKHNIEIVIDRLNIVTKDKSEEEIINLRKRVADSVELAIKEGGGLVNIAEIETDGFTTKDERIFSTAFACVDCGFSYGEISPRLFSFNAPYGACPACHGLGIKMEVDEERIIADPELSIIDGAIASWGEVTSAWFLSELEDLARTYNFDLKTPWKKLPKSIKNIIIYGPEDDSFEGVIPHIMRLYQETESDAVREWAEKFMSVLPCPACQGTRLKTEALAVKINERNIADITRMSISEAYEFFTQKIKLTEKESLIAKEVIKEITRRLSFLISVGLDYLTLDRRTDTLGGGEEQRVRLATQIGSGLVGVIYILDEPSIGLHQRDNRKLLQTLLQLRDLGNTVIVVEHDEETIRNADYVIDLGPGAGENGGRVVAVGTPEEIMQNSHSLTGAYLSGQKTIPLPAVRRKPRGDFLIIKGARENNLKNITVKIPLGLFVCITGVSGSGKSTLIFDILYNKLAEVFYNSKIRAGAHDAILNIDKIDKVINIDQSPIGRTPRSNPATYTNVFTPIRELFAQTKEANVYGGRCERCQGDGIIKVEMHFLPPVYIPCEECHGRRYNRETLEVKYKGKNIYEVLEMSVNEAYEFFANIPPIKRKLELLKDVG